MTGFTYANQIKRAMRGADGFERSHIKRLVRFFKYCRKANALARKERYRAWAKYTVLED